MANVILRQDEQQQLLFYIAKKDLEEVVTAIEFNEDTKWGGELTLGNGSRYSIDVLDARPSLPKTVRARRI